MQLGAEPRGAFLDASTDPGNADAISVIGCLTGLGCQECDLTGRLTTARSQHGRASAAPASVSPNGGAVHAAAPARPPSPILVAVGDIVEPSWRGPVDTADSAYLALKANVRASGVIKPVLLRRMPDGTLQIVSGMRRVRAARDTGQEAVPATIAVLTDVESAAAAWDGVIRDGALAVPGKVVEERIDDAAASVRDDGAPVEAPPAQAPAGQVTAVPPPWAWSSASPSAQAPRDDPSPAATVPTRAADRWPSVEAKALLPPVVAPVARPAATAWSPLLARSHPTRPEAAVRPDRPLTPPPPSISNRALFRHAVPVGQPQLERRPQPRTVPAGGSRGQGMAPAQGVPERGGRRDRGMDALRGLAALMTVAVHGMYSFASSSPPVGEYGFFLALLTDGVSLFFVISGYLISRPFIVALVDGGPQPRLLDYARRRALRILPAYWIWFAVSAAMLGVGSVAVTDGRWTGIDLGGWASGLGMVALIAPSNAIDVIPQGWTLTIEAMFYCTVPVLAVVAHRACRGHRLHPVAVCIPLLLLWAGSAWALARVYTYAPNTVAYNAAFVAGFAGLLIPGMILALATTKGVRERIPRLSAAMGAPASRAAALLVAGLAMWGSVSFFEANAPSATAQLYREFGSVAGVFAVAACLGSRALWWRMLCRLLAPIGAAAYSLYLVHILVVRQMIEHGFVVGASVSSDYRWMADLTCLMVLSVLLAGISYWLIEKPAMDLGRLLNRRSASRRPGDVVRSGGGAVVAPLGRAPIGVVAAIPDPPESFS